jgi:hypothetical protein
MSDSVDTLRELEGLRTQLDARARKISLLMERTQAPGDLVRARSMSRTYVGETTADVKRAAELLRRVEVESASSGDTHATAAARGIGQTVQEAIRGVSEAQSALLRRVQALESQGAKRRAGFGAAGRYDDAIDLDEDDVPMLLHSGQQHALEQRQQQEDASLAQEFYNAAMLDRNAEVVALLEGVKELNLIMSHMSEIVAEQAEDIETVAVQVDRAHSQVEAGSRHLHEARGPRRGNLSWRMHVGAFSILIVIVLLLVFAATR